jgi:hypothetical protein
MSAEPVVHTLYLRLAPSDIAFVKFLFESYEEVGLVRTLDREAAVIVLLIAPDFLPVARAILDDLGSCVSFTEVDAPPAPGDDWLMHAVEQE